MQPRRALSSPTLRCRQTIAPLAGAHGLTVEVDERLGEHGDDDPWDVVLALVDTDTVICTHGPQLKNLGFRVPGFVPGPPGSEPGLASGWRLRVRDGRIESAERVEAG